MPHMLRELRWSRAGTYKIGLLALDLSNRNFPAISLLRNRSCSLQSQPSNVKCQTTASGCTWPNCACGEPPKNKRHVTLRGEPRSTEKNSV
ncbi:hypothetical protein NEOLEDRAFT_1138854 [Neolentinus lepideus HHB14362 ss-1]|uniref:Uncharacterized protein n=1 Tax=Neolentinus lepideus HHB14362 ss-1 TaxID=1314782 RepID=A0A165Q319_9AGAM|nr:hypothetical protein NEOLEDRAFT_1138854 [Neolentinus lepideus HHB14362 ss-1]